MTNHNQDLFTEIRSLELPPDQYAVTASGPLGIRGIRLINDIDILITNVLWDTLRLTHPTITENAIKKIRLSKNIEAVYEGSFANPDTAGPRVEEQIRTA